MITQLKLLIREWIAARFWLAFLRVCTPEQFNACVAQIEGKRMPMSK
jgi:hypothetical protein